MVQRVVFTDTDKNTMEGILESMGFIAYDNHKDRYDLYQHGEIHLQINLNAMTILPPSKLTSALN